MTIEQAIMAYADRPQSANDDGTPVFASDGDRANEDRVRRSVEAAWNCRLQNFGRLCPIDFYALRHERLVAVLEVKSRSHPVGKFETVFLNVRKWLALLMAESGLGVPAIFVVQFTDAIRYIHASRIDASRCRIGGTARLVKSHTDIEPVIEVPVADMRPLSSASEKPGGGDGAEDTCSDD